jgi:hypothetical protein
VYYNAVEERGEKYKPGIIPSPYLPAVAPILLVHYGETQRPGGHFDLIERRGRAATYILSNQSSYQEAMEAAGSTPLTPAAADQTNPQPQGDGDLQARIAARASTGAVTGEGRDAFDRAAASGQGAAKNNPGYGQGDDASMTTYMQQQQKQQAAETSGDSTKTDAAQQEAQLAQEKQAQLEQHRAAVLGGVAQRKQDQASAMQDLHSEEQDRKTRLAGDTGSATPSPTVQQAQSAVAQPAVTASVSSQDGEGTTPTATITGGPETWNITIQLNNGGIQTRTTGPAGGDTEANLVGLASQINNSATGTGAATSTATPKPEPGKLPEEKKTALQEAMDKDTTKGKCSAIEDRSKCCSVTMSDNEGNYLDCGWIADPSVEDPERDGKCMPFRVLQSRKETNSCGATILPAPKDPATTKEATRVGIPPPDRGAPPTDAALGQISRRESPRPRSAAALDTLRKQSQQITDTTALGSSPPIGSDEMVGGFEPLFKTKRKRRAKRRRTIRKKKRGKNRKRAGRRSRKA